MNNQSNPTRVRIHSHITQSRFLHVEDALNIGQGKIRLFAGRYRRSEGMEAHGFHFLDLADARIIFGALARGEQGFAHKEYKGTPPRTRPEQGRRDGSGAISRTLSVAIKGGNVYIELKTGPGKLTNTGAITPKGPAKTEVNVGFKLYEARRMAASVLAYIHAWDVMRMMINQEMVSQPSSYLLVSTTSEVNGSKAAPANGALKPNDATRPPAAAPQNGRPVTRKGQSPKGHGTTTKKTNGQLTKTPATVANAQPLKYGDGSAI
ncbi:MAG: hypothetical protein GY792_06450, partial [Gammaproteobacteria bacterium]|nr:hypothetical protein [Gammaproteobacteria bacterium]